MSIHPILWLKVLTSNDRDFTRDLRNNNREYFHNHEEISIDQHDKWFDERLRDKIPTFHIIMLGDTKIGTISIDNHGNIGEIGNVVIDSYQRGEGYGKRAMYIAMGLAVSRGASVLRISVEVGNSVATLFYEKLGFISKAVIMEKSCL